MAPLALNKVNLDRFVDIINQLKKDLSEEYSLLKRQNQFALRRLEKKQAKQIISTEEVYLYREFYQRETNSVNTRYPKGYLIWLMATSSLNV